MKIKTAKTINHSNCVPNSEYKVFPVIFLGKLVGYDCKGFQLFIDIKDVAIHAMEEK